MDLGGVAPNTEQYAELDRLYLVDGETYTMRLFYAHRQSLESVFGLQTNVVLSPAAVLPTVGYPAD